MAANVAVRGFGAKLQLSISSVYTTIADIKSITGPTTSRETYDVTHMESPNGWREHIAGLKDGGEVSSEINYNPTAVTHQALLDTYESNSVSSWKIIFSDTSTITFSGILTKLDISAPMDNAMTASITIKVTGEPTFPS